MKRKLGKALSILLTAVLVLNTTGLTTLVEAVATTPPAIVNETDPTAPTDPVDPATPVCAGLEGCADGVHNVDCPCYVAPE